MVDKSELTSAFMDGELSQREVNDLLNELYTNDELRIRWQRYHLIGEAMRNNLPLTIHSDLASRVSAAVKDEPVILAPHPMPVSQNGGTPKKQSKVKVGYAVAASLALVGFVAVFNLNYEAKQMPQVASSVPLTNPTIADNAGSVATKPHVVLTADIRQTMVVDRLEPNTSKVQSYVLEHEYSSLASSRPGLPPGVRVVTFSSER